MLSRQAPIVGLTFYLDDQSHVQFGRQGSMEISAFIDGPREEVISRVTVKKSVKNDWVLTLQIRTNLGNKLIFEVDELEYSQVTEFRPIPGLGQEQPNPYIQPEQKTVETLEAPSGQQITGFTVIQHRDKVN
ncbi:hypothetical protein BDW62DRAFT_199079 [Aspergillus aurantiobrunneus]